MVQKDVKTYINKVISKINELIVSVGYSVYLIYVSRDDILITCEIRRSVIK